MSAIIFRTAPKARNLKKQCNVISRLCKKCFAQEMRACARMTRRFRGGAVAVSLRIGFQTFRSGNCSVFDRFVPEIVPFSRKTHQTCHCEEGAAFAPDAAIFNESTCHPGTNYGCAERNRTLEGRERTRNEAANLMFLVIGLPSCFVLPCFATGCHAFSFKIATSLRSSQ